MNGFSIDTTAVTDAITAVATAAGTIGAGILVMLIGIKAYHWVRRAMS